MDIYLLRDPETGRIALQANEPDDGSRPLGMRGAGWDIRRGELPDQVWTSLLAGRIAPEAQDLLHRNLWEDAA